MQSPIQDASAPRPDAKRAITWRSVLLGTFAVILVCGLTPYNDYVVYNTPLVASHLPVVVVLFFFLLVVLVNAPLHRWAPRSALGEKELAVVMAMMLVSCCIPAQGLMRVFIPTMVFPFRLGQLDPAFWRTFTALNLPEWLFPVGPMAEGRSSAIVSDFYGRSQPDESVPYAAWIKPVLGWGAFVAGLYATLVSLAWLVRVQWGVNERLPFPLVQLELSLIEQPSPGRALNDTFRSRLFWMALAAVFCVQSLGALNKYFPKVYPAIPMGYDFVSMFADPPWSHLPADVRKATIFFSFVGVTYFIQTRVAFSLWATYIIIQLIASQFKAFGTEIPQPAYADQHLGGCLVFVGGVLWIGRKHWAMIGRHLFRGRSEQERRAGAESYRLPAIALLVGLAVMFGWLTILGVHLWMSVLVVGVILLAHVVTTRVVAETGLPVIRAIPTVQQITTNLPPSVMTGRDIFFGNTLSMNGAFATAQTLMGFATHGLRVADGANLERRERRSLVVLIAWALFLGFFVSAASHLWCQYRYDTTLDTAAPLIVNSHGAETVPRNDVVTPMNQWAAGRWTPKPYNPYAHFGVGVFVTGVLQLGAWRFASWPLLPVGFIVATGTFISWAWFSIMIGWGLKVLIVRFGGAQLFVRAKPFFIGIIFGEAVAAGVWLAINLYLAATGGRFITIRFLPS